MTGKMIAAALAFVATSACAENYAACLLDEMPRHKNLYSARIAAKRCAELHPGALAVVEAGSGIGWFGPKNPQECVLAKASDVSDAEAARLISIACHCLYRTPKFSGEKCWP